jgi:cytochrome c oxidase subunit II
LLLGVAVVGTACSDNAPQDILAPLGRAARKADHLWDITFFLAVVVFIIVEGVLVFALIRFRHKPGRRAAQFHGNTRVEVLLTIIPSLILAGLAVPTVKTIFDLSRQPTGDFVEVNVHGRQFWWKYEYPQFQITTANELHIPVGKAVKVSITGDDVIHSWWVPRLSGKQDAIPTRTNSLVLFADKPGRFMGQCTEFCGLSHANMRLIVYAEEESDFEQWVSDQQQDAATPSGDGAEGEKLFMEGACVGCHAIQGTDAQADVGPDLTHFASRTTFAGSIFENNTENLSAWLRDPPGVKPGSKMPNYHLSSEDIRLLVAYLQSLK